MEVNKIPMKDCVACFCVPENATRVVIMCTEEVRSLVFCTYEESERIRKSLHTSVPES